MNYIMVVSFGKILLISGHILDFIFDQYCVPLAVSEKPVNTRD